MTPAIAPTSSLADRAVIVNLSISQWSAKKTDKKVNREVAAKNGNAENMGNYRKSLVARDALKKFTELAGTIRAEHYRLSLPWRDGGDRVLSSSAYFQYSQAMRARQQELEASWQEFCECYPQYVEDARVQLNGLFDANDYPPVAEIRKKFSFRLEVLPLTVADDFRVNLGDAETARIKEQIQRDATAQLGRAMADVWDRMHEVIAAMADRLKLYTRHADGTIEHTFRDTLVTNITDLLDVLPLLNITNDPNVADFAQQMRASLTQYPAERLRDDAFARRDTAARADEILSKMSAFMA
jgi:hypothetical protein